MHKKRVYELETKQNKIRLPCLSIQNEVIYRKCDL
jgi:hypothetical protein